MHSVHVQSDIWLDSCTCTHIDRLHIHIHLYCERSVHVYICIYMWHCVANWVQIWKYIFCVVSVHMYILPASVQSSHNIDDENQPTEQRNTIISSGITLYIDINMLCGCSIITCVHIHNQTTWTCLKPIIQTYCTN